MNALLKQQVKLENKFLQTVNTYSFENLCYSHIKYFKNYLNHQKSYPNFTKRTRRGTLPLEHFEDLVTYIALYGLAHYQRMQSLLAHIQPLSDYPYNTAIKLAVVDYGCGQGIATLALIDHLIASPYKIEALDILLIEPSALALNRAQQWVKVWASKQPNIQVNITVRQQYLDELDEDFLSFNQNNYFCIHLFSNILDLYYHGSFNITQLCNNITQKHGEHFFIAISPNYPVSEIGFDIFHSKLKPTATYINSTGEVPVKEFSFKLFDFCCRKAPVRAYVAYHQVIK